MAIGPWDWFASTGIFGWLIVAVTISLLGAAMVAALVRVRRITAFLLLLACALPLLVGVAGMFVGRAQTERVLETLKAPTDEDREVGYAEATRCLIVGAIGMFVCDSVALLAVLRSQPPAPPPA